jgi:hypothetical protein
VSRPELDELLVADPPGVWADLGFTVAGDEVVVGGVRIRLGVEGQGIVGWSLRTGPPDAPPEPVQHPLGVSGIDHVVMLTPDFDRTLGALRADGFDHRSTRDAGNGFRQAFFVLGPCLLELGGPAEGDTRLWGLTLVVDDIHAAAARLGNRLGHVKDAVQAGRRIATVRPEAGLSVPLALITPRAKLAFKAKPGTRKT